MYLLCECHSQCSVQHQPCCTLRLAFGNQNCSVAVFSVLHVYGMNHPECLLASRIPDTLTCTRLQTCKCVRTHRQTRTLSHAHKHSTRHAHTQHTHTDQMLFRGETVKKKGYIIQCALIRKGVLIITPCLMYLLIYMVIYIYIYNLMLHLLCHSQPCS